MNIPKYIESFRNEITRKGYRQTSIKNYVSCVEIFLLKFDGVVAEPIKINEQQIKDYLRLFKEQNTQRANHSAIKCFFKYVLNQPNKFRYIEYCKKNQRLPIVHSKEEIEKLISVCDNKKHRAIICLMYACGLRVSEVINLKIADVDSSRMVINILNAKGGIDRQVMLPQVLLEMFREYYKLYKPKEYLFNGQNSVQYTSRSISQILKKCSEKAGLKKRIYPHLIRHDSFTHLLESGCDIGLIQKIAGHKNIATTNIYLHTSHTFISKINSPLNNIKL